MLALAAKYPEYAESAKKVQLIEVQAKSYYGDGYQDVKNRVPKIENTCADLNWKPRVSMEQALERIFESYRTHVRDAQDLLN